MSALNYTRKGPGIEAFRIDYSTVDLLDLVFWLGTGYQAVKSLSMPWIVVTNPSDEPVMWVGSGEYIVKDSNGKLFKLTQEMLTCFYDLVE